MRLLDNPAIRIIIAIVLGLIILTLSSYVERFVHVFSPRILESLVWLSAALQSISLLIFSLIIILIIARGNLSLYGFTMGKEVKYLKIVVFSLIASIVIIIITSIIAAILQALYPIGGGEHLASKYSFLETVFFVWILASISEEIFVRGLIQGYLMPLKKYGFALFKKYISLPVVISGLFFGGMHLMLLTTGMDIYMVFAVFVSTCVLGFIAGYYREKTESIIPAIVVHMMFNIAGTLLSMLG